MRRHRKKDKECSTELQHIYIDTCYFHAYLWGKHEEKTFSKKIMKKIENSIKKNSNIKVIIPFTIVGELLNNMYQDSFDTKKIEDYFYKFLNLIEKLRADLRPSKSNEFFNIATKIREKDNRIGNTDILILSHALCDPNSKYALFIDQDVLHSTVIRDMEEKMRQEGKRRQKLEITSEFGKLKR